MPLSAVPKGDERLSQRNLIKMMLKLVENAGKAADNNDDPLTGFIFVAYSENHTFHGGAYTPLEAAEALQSSADDSPQLASALRLV